MRRRLLQVFGKKRSWSEPRTQRARGVSAGPPLTPRVRCVRGSENACFFRLALLAVLLSSATLVIPARAQEAESRTIPFEGPEIVCHILHTFKMEPIVSLEEAAKDPVHTVIVVFGDPHILGELHKATGSLNRYRKEGGNLLVATDRQFRDDDLRIQVSGRIVTVPANLKEWDAYHTELQCPKLNYYAPFWPKINDDFNELRHLFVPRQKDVRDHPLFSFLQKWIATNCPSNVDVSEDDTGLQDLLVFPFGTPRITGGGLRGGPMRYMVGSPKDTPPHGRALFIAGHGMFMNGMMLQPDNDNFAFTANAVRWLREGTDEPRTKALFIVNGEIITNFDMKLTPPPPPIPIPPMKMLGRLIRGLENERFFHRVLGEATGSHIGVVVAVIFGVVTIMVLLYGAKKFMAGRHHVETAVPSMVGASPPMNTTEPIEQRQQALLRQGEFRTEARQLVLDWLRQEFDVTPDRWRAEVDARFSVTELFWTRGRLQNKADTVLRLARLQPPHISRHEFYVLVESLQELSGALKQGRLALLVDGKNVRQP